MIIRPKARPDKDGLPAGFVTRLVAFLIDLALLSLIITTVTVLGQFIGQSLNLSVWTLRLIALGTSAFSAGLYIVYFIGLHALGGQTLGKRIMGVRLVRVDGSRVRLRVSARRYLASWLSLPLFWGYLLVLIDNRRRAFHDKVANTIVIYYTIPPDEPGPLEQYLIAMRIRREARLAEEQAALAAQQGVVDAREDSPTPLEAERETSLVA